jgi:hypothetical protein
MMPPQLSLVPTSFLDHALGFASRGWRVFPLAPNEKIPLIAKADGGNGCLDATTDPTVIRGWWQKAPKAGIGFACGPDSGVWVLDIDPEKGGSDSFAAMENHFGTLPETLEVKTGSGGRHLYFKWPAGRQLKNRKDLRGALNQKMRGIDVRADGGYVVLPPSGHPSGTTYAWAWDSPVADAPPWLLDLVDPPKAPPPMHPAPRYHAPLPTDRDRAYVTKALRNTCDQIRTSSKGERHDAIIRGAYSLGGWVPLGLVAEAEMAAELVAAGVATGKDPNEVQRAVTDGLRDGAKAPRVLPGAIALSALDAVIKAVREAPDDRTRKLEARPLVADEAVKADLAAARLARPDELASRLLDLSAERGFGATVDKIEREIQKRIQKAQEDAKRAAAPTPEDEADSGRDLRPRIVISSAEAAIVERALVAIRKAPELYVRGGNLVRVKTDEHERGTIEPCPEKEIRRILSQEINWVRIKAAPDSPPVEMPASPPQHVSHQIASLGAYRDFRGLVGVSGSPILRPDGTIAAENGYDAGSKWLLQVPEALVVDVPAEPDANQVADALCRLRDVLRDFPFAKPTHEAAALALLLTMVARTHFRGPSPLFLVTGSTAAAGKGLLIKCMTLIAHGVLPDSLPYSGEEEETRKRVTSILSVGALSVMLDNIPNGQRLGNAILDSLLTATEWTDRPLGSTAILRLPSLAVWSATGNNIGVRGDMVRRTVPIRLEPKQENPEERTGLRDLEAFVLQNRGQLLSDALTVLRGYLAAGSPHADVPDLGSYGGWSMVRRALVHAGAADPCEGMADFREANDEKSEEHDAILDGFELAYGKRGRVPGADLAIRFAHPRDDADRTNPLGVLLRAQKNKSGDVDVQRVGNLLGRYRNTVRKGRYLDKEKSNGTWFWLIRGVGEVAP